MQPVTPAGALRSSMAWFGFGEQDTGMLALGTAMIGCRKLENGYRSLGATGLEVPQELPDERDRPPRGAKTKRPL